MTRALLTSAQVAQTYGLPVDTLKQWRYMRKGPAWITLGRHVRYAPEDVEAYLAAQRVDPARVG
jgi:hypothetical protein